LIKNSTRDRYLFQNIKNFNIFLPRNSLMDTTKPIKKPKFRRNFEQILASSTLNILFLIDTTGSMDPYRDLCSEAISLISEKLSGVNALFPSRKAVVKLGFVAYRDIKDKVPFEFCEFTQNQENMISMVKNLECEGGGDECENVKGAFQKVLSDPNIKWDAQYKFLVMIADSPCHGKLYHTTEEDDDYPEEIMSEEIKLLVTNEINFIGMLFTDSTKIMYQEIEKIYKGNHGSFYLIDHEDLKNIKSHNQCSQNILNLFVERISQPIEQLTKSTINTFLKEKKISRVFQLIGENASECNWEKFGKDDDTFLPEELYEVYNFTCDTKTIQFQNVGAFEVNTLKINEWRCQMSTKPLGRGSFRNIYLLKVAKIEPKKDDPTPYHLYIAKAPIAKTHYTDIEEIKYEWRGSLVASNMAKKFNKDLYGVGNEGDLTLSFNDVFILKSKKSFEGENGKIEYKYFAVEKVLKGPFTKYNNNFGFVADFSQFKEKTQELVLFNEVAQSFSHYSFQKSDGYILICDLQGVVQKLTDPMILNKNKTNLQGDLSGPGIAQFFQKHQCNDICQKLNLEKMNELLTDDMKKEIEEISIKLAENNKVKTLSTISDNDDDSEKEEEKKEEEACRFKD